MRGLAVLLGIALLAACATPEAQYRSLRGPREMPLVLRPPSADEALCGEYVEYLGVSAGVHLLRVRTVKSLVEFSDPVPWRLVKGGVDIRVSEEQFLPTLEVVHEHHVILRLPPSDYDEAKPCLHALFDT